MLKEGLFNPEVIKDLYNQTWGFPKDKEPPQIKKGITRRRFLKDAGILSLAAGLATAFGIWPTSSASADSPVSDSSKKEPDPTLPQTITAQALTIPFNLGGGETDTATPVSGVSLDKMMEYGSKGFNTTLSAEKAAKDPIIAAKAIFSMAEYADGSGKVAFPSSWSAIPTMERLALKLPGETKVNTSINGFVFKPGVNLNILGIGDTGFGTGPEVFVSADEFPKGQDVPNLYMPAIPVNEFNKLLSASNIKLDYLTNTLTYFDADGKTILRSVVLNNIDTDLAIQLDRAGGALYIDKDITGKTYKNKIVTWPEFAQPYNGVKRNDVTGYVYAIDLNNNPFMQAVYNDNTNIWEWITLLTNNEITAAIQPYAEAMNIKIEDVKPGQLVHYFNGDPYLALDTANGATLMCTMKNKDGKFEWQAMPIPGFAFPSQEIVNGAYKLLNLTAPAEAITMRYDVRPNLNDPNKTPIVYARDPKTNKVILATRLNPQTNEYEWKAVGLRDYADALGIKLGIQAGDPFFVYKFTNSGESVDDIVLRNFNNAILEQTASHQTEKVQGQFTTYTAEAWATKAKKNGATVRGNLLYGLSDFKNTYLGNLSNPTREQLIDIMRNHIVKLMTNLKGEVDYWIVANESNPPSMRNLNNTGPYDPYWDIIGPDYLDLAFQIARETDPSAKLIYNGTRNEVSGGKHGQSTQLTREIVTRLKGKGLIDGVGIEMHLDASDAPDINDLKNTLLSYGLPIYITEFDVNMSGISGTSEEKYRRQADIYLAVFKACLDIGVKYFDFWDLGDPNSWLVRGGGNPNAMPTMFDNDLQPKPAYDAIEKELRQRLGF